MQPAPELILKAFVASLDGRLASLPPGPEVLMLWTIRTTFDAFAQEVDCAAANRLDEINELRALISDTAIQYPPELASRMRQALAKVRDAERNIRIRALEDHLDVLKVALIELHAWLETSGDPRAPEMIARCWSFLRRASAQRPRMELPW